MVRTGIQVLGALAEVPRERWDALLDPQATPFVSWAWLDALERSRCASPRAGWTPRHLTLWRKGELIAAAPAYLKPNSDGDFSRDWGWARAAEEAGLSLHPKLVLTVPFTPVTGRRILVAPGEDRAACAQALLDAARELAAEEGLGTVQVLYPDRADLALLDAAGFARRIDFQYHWYNAGYASPDDFLARFTSKHRHMLKRERAAPAGQGIVLRTVRGEALASDARRWADEAHALHRATVDKLLWGRRWLNADFYRRIFASMPEHLELVVAEREGRVIAGAFNVAAGDRLYGRYWGCREAHPFLHFNVCYYHSMDECIRRGVRVFEGGAGGEHKVARGFEPSETFSAHLFTDPRLDVALRAHLAEEWRERQAAVENWRRESPLFKRSALEPGAPR